MNYTGGLYSETSNTQQTAPAFFFKKWWWAILLFIGWMWFRSRPDTPHIELPKLDVVMAFIGFFTFLVRYLDRELQLMTAKIIWTDGHSTTWGYGIPVGEYACFTLGDINFGISWRGNKGIAICPASAVNQLGHQVVLNCRLKQVGFNQLPLEVKELITAKNWKGPYLFGLFNEEEEYEMDKSDLIRLEKSFEKTNEYVSLLEETNDNILKSTQEAIEGSTIIVSGLKEAKSNKSSDWDLLRKQNNRDSDRNRDRDR